jgi:hypothetical protein
MIGTILLVTSALIFNACCKDADIPTDLKSFKIEDVRGKAEMEMTVTFKSQYLSTSNFDDGLFGDNPFVFGLHFAGGSQLWATPSDEISPYVYMSGSDYALDGADVMTVLQANYIANKDNSLPLTVSFSGLVMTIKWTDSLVNGLGNAGGIIVFEPNAKTPALRENWITLSSTSIGYTYFDDVSNGFGSFTLTQTDSFAYKLIVNINGFDTDVTSEVVGNLWERLASEDIITTYKITSEDGLTTYRAGTVEIF